MKYIPILFIILMMACEQVVEIDVPEQEPQITLSCFYKSGDMQVRASLNNSLGILVNEDIIHIVGASVKLYENEVLMAEFVEGADTLFRDEYIGEDSLGYPIYEQVVRRITPFYQTELSAPLQAGNTYKITAEAEGYAAVSATQKFPLAPTIGDLIYKPMSRVDIEGYLSDAFEFRIHDTPEEDNYYAMTVYECSTNYYYSYCNDNWTSSFTPGTVRGLNGAILLKDDLFDGESYEVELLSEAVDTAHRDLKVIVSAITRDGYFFSKSVEAYWIAEDNPFVEPVIIPTNVENGQGIFSIENMSEIIVE